VREIGRGTINPRRFRGHLNRDYFGRKIVFQPAFFRGCVSLVVFEGVFGVALALDF